jgi:hypothetical protein
MGESPDRKKGVEPRWGGFFTDATADTDLLRSRTQSSSSIFAVGGPVIVSFTLARMRRTNVQSVSSPGYPTLHS